MTTLISRQDDTLDLLLWRDAGLAITAVQPVLDANPGLAGRCAVLPIGTIVSVPQAASPAPYIRPLVQLWD